MSRRGNCYNNASTESFLSRFKAELFDDGHFISLAEAKLKISYYIVYYSAESQPRSLDYLVPNRFIA